jgi:SAM-dependent methyltransferase
MYIKLEHVNCDLCGSTKYKIRYKKPDNWLWINQFEYPVVKCINCGLVYVNPRPCEEYTGLFYPAGYHAARDTSEHLKRYKIQSKFLPILKNEKILDIGCARGDFLIYLKQIYPDISAYGVDLFSDKTNSKDIKFYKKNLKECNFNAWEFDIVTAWAVFEHLLYPSQYFEEVSRILKKKGKFIFLVTNAESLYGRRAYIEDVPRHTYHYSEKTLQQYAHKYGFIFNRCTYDDSIFDGRGIGTFHYLFSAIAGVSWEDRYYKTINLFQKILIKSGNLLDKFFFKFHWEAYLKRSGIIIVEFEKQ